MRGILRATRTIPAVALVLAGAGCGYMPIERGTGQSLPPDYASMQPEAPISGHRYALNADDDIVGETQVALSNYADTFSDIARRFNLGYGEMKLANPDVDPWLPGDATPTLLPTQFILPDAPREGIVLNVATMRLFYYPPKPKYEPAAVITHPVGIGRIDWATPVGVTEVVGKARDPVWYVPRSIRQEHAAAGDPLRSVVPPGPDNPLGEFVLQLGIPGYLIHGTNQPYGVGMRVSHGCVRLYPEDIAPLFEDIPIGTPVHIVNQPYLLGWQNGYLHLEAHPPLADDERNWNTELIALVSDDIDDAGYAERKIDWNRVQQVAEAARGVPVSISKRTPGPESVLANARFVENTLPASSNLSSDPAFGEYGTSEDPALAQSGAD